MLLVFLEAMHVFTKIGSLHQQLKQRRLALGLKQSDMLMRIGVSRQQYQRLESQGNPRLDTLELVAKGLKGQVVFIPQEKLDEVMALLSQQEKPTQQDEKMPSLADDPWQGLLGDSE